MERHNFEKEWRDAFDQAGLSPSDARWGMIELELEKNNGGNLRRAVLTFKLLAVASIAFALAIGGAGIYVYHQNNLVHREISQTNGVGLQPGHYESSQFDPLSPAGNSDSKGFQVKKGKNPVYKNDRIRRYKGNHDGGAKPFGEMSTAAPIGLVKLTGIGDRLEVAMNEHKLPPLLNKRKPVLRLYKTEPDALDVLLANLAFLEKEEKKVKDKENMWTSLGMSAGFFDSPARGGSGSSSLAFVTDATKAMAPSQPQQDISGTAYSIGLSLGGKVSNRWVVQGGVNYLSQNSNFVSQTIMSSGTSVKASSLISLSSYNSRSENFSQTAPYHVTSTLEFMSVPLQAGYLLINRSFSLQLNGGVSTDVFLKNTLIPDASNVSSVSQGAGIASPYRTLNFSGMLSTELGYRFSDHYRVTLNPGVKHPFYSIYKTETGASLNPLTIEVALRFRYIF